MSPLYSSVYLCSSSFCLLWPFSTIQRSSGWRQLAYASPRSITRAQTSPALWCNDARLEGTKVSYAATRSSDSTRGWRTTCLLQKSRGSPQRAGEWRQERRHASFSTTLIHLLEKASDVVFAAGRPGERVGVGCYVSGHQFGCLVAFGTTRIPNPIMVHPKTETHRT